MSDNAAYSDDYENTSKLLRHLRGQTSRTALAQMLGVSASTVRRWEEDETQVFLASILEIMDVHTRILDIWLLTFFRVNNLPFVEEFSEIHQNVLEVISRQPIAGAVTAYLDLAEYKESPKHDEEKMAKHLGVSSIAIASCLGSLREAGYIVFRNGKYCTNPTPIETTNSTSQSRQNIRSYWYRRILQALQKPFMTKDHQSRLAYLLHPVSDQTYQVILERQLNFFKEVHYLIRTDEQPKSRIFYIGIDLVCVAELSKNDELTNSSTE